MTTSWPFATCRGRRSTPSNTSSRSRLPSSGFGLTGLTERVADAGGRLSAGPADPGWRVTPEPAPTEPLTERETALVKLVAQLYVTPATVKTHLANIQRKLTFRNRVEIAAWAWRTGLAR